MSSTPSPGPPCSTSTSKFHEPKLPRLLRDLGRKKLLLVVLSGDGDDLFGREATRGFLELLLLGRQIETHHFDEASGRGAACGRRTAITLLTRRPFISNTRSS